MRAAAVAAMALAFAGCMEPDRTGAPLELADARLEIVQQDGVKHVFSLSAAGALAFDGEPIATVTKHGILMVDGKAAGKLEKDGVLWAGGHPSNATIRPDGTFVLAGTEEVVFAPDNTASGPLFETMDHPKMNTAGAKVTYAGPPGARRALMTGFAAYVTRAPLVPAPTR